MKGNANEPSPKFDREFAEAIEAGDVTSVKRLLKLQPGLANAPGWTPPPLHCAVLWDHPEVLEILLDNGADIETLDPDRQTTPLRYAVVYCKDNLIPVLLARGANSGRIKQDGTTLFELATEGAEGCFDGYDDLPTKDDYRRIVTLLRQLDLSEGDQRNSSAKSSSG